jgi:DNA-binding transcriptional LysR family regulator
MDLDTLDLRKVRAFYLVARYGSLQSAASRLNITVSAVSISIRRLEEQLGIQLFHRFPNRLALTAVGDRFADSAEAIFAGIDRVFAESELDMAASGRLSISVNTGLAWYFLPKIRDFLKRYPDIELAVHIKNSSKTLQLVEKGEVDFGIGRFRQVSRALEVKPLIESSISLVCGSDHPLAHRGVPRLEELGRHKLVILAEGHSTREIIDTVFAKAGIRLKSHIDAGNCHTVKEFVEAGLGVGLVHSFCARRDRLEKLHYIDLSCYFGKGTFSAIYPKESVSSPALLKKLQTALLTRDAKSH